MVLQAFREKLTGVAAIFLFAFIAVPFAFVGVNSYFSAGTENLVARINDRDITVNEFNENFGNYRRQMQSLMGAAFDPRAFESLAQKREFLETMIDEEVLAQAAREIRLDIDDARLARQIRDIPAFHVEGQFDTDVYLSRLTSQGISVKQFERQVRDRFIMSQLPASLMSSSITTKSELEDYVGLQDQTRNFKATLVQPVKNETALPPGEEAVQAYYDQNQAAFQTEEMVQIEYVELDVADIPVAVEPDEAFLRNRFEQQRTRFMSPERRQVSHVLIEAVANADEAVKETARQAAEDIARRARAGEDFAELAREFSDDIGSAEAGGDLGWLGPGIMSENFEEAMYGLKLENPVSDPVQTGFGWHVILLRNIEPSAGLDFEEARETLIQEHHAEEAEREFLEKADRLVDLIYEDPTTLDAAALDLGLDVLTTQPFSRSGGEGIAANPDVVTAAFSDLVLLQGSVSDPVELAINHIIMLRVAEHFPVDVKPLDEVREQIVQRLQEQEALEDARERAEAMLVQVRQEGASLEGVAEQAGLEVIDVEGATRQSLVPDRMVVSEVFLLEAPAEDEARYAVVPAASGYALVALQSVTPGVLDQDSPMAALQYRRQIANAAATIEVTGLMRQLREAANVEVFEERLR